MEGQVEHIALWDAGIHTFILHILANVLLNIKFPKGGFTSDAIEEPFLVPQKPFSEQFLNVIFCYFEEHFNTLKNLLCNGKVLWVLKLLHGTIDANKESLFYYY